MSAIPDCSNIELPAFMYARMYETGKQQSLMVYRSTMVRDDDPCYEPVAKWRVDADEVYSVLVEDEMMMMGTAELACYAKEIP
ncbi:hypothetical protein ACWF99_23745 [Nocardia sp. NPDC055002]